MKRAVGQERGPQAASRASAAALLQAVRAAALPCAHRVAVAQCASLATGNGGRAGRRGTVGAPRGRAGRARPEGDLLDGRPDQLPQLLAQAAALADLRMFCAWCQRRVCVRFV